jgi:DNA replication protein DnaC
MATAKTSINDVMAAAERARQACEDRDRRQGIREPNRERQDASEEILRRLPAYLRERTDENTHSPVYVTTATLETRINDRRLLDAARSWHWQSGNLVLGGVTGAGKSTAAAVIVRRMVAEGVRLGGFYWNDARGIWWFAALELELARKQHPLGQGEAPEVSRACAARLLVVDDAGWERDPTAVSYVLDHRMQRGVQTIVTTGRTRSELSDHYGAAVVRRFVETGGKLARIVECFDPPPDQQQAEHDVKMRAAGGD